MVVVDDDAKVRSLLERAFRAPEFETHTFPTAAAALRAVARIRPDCVVSDILMPDMDGEGLLRGMRALPGLERVPFIAVSAVRSEPRIRSVLEAGADAFLLKPFPLRELLEKVRALLDRPAAARPAVDRTSDYTSPTRPVVAAPHTTSTAAVRRKPSRGAPRTPSEAETSPPSVRVAPVRVVVPPQGAPGATAPLSPVKGAAPAAAGAFAGSDGVRQIEIAPPGGSLGFGRFTRVEARGRSFVVLTEATAHPRFLVTTVITEKGVPLRRIESALPHPLAREDDQDTVRRQLDLQHDDTLRRLDALVLDATPRRVVWSDHSRGIDARLLAWAMSAVAQLAEIEAGTDETARQLRLTRERALVEEDTLRAFDVSPSGRVMVTSGHDGRLPRRAVRAVARWCRDFAVAALQLDADEVLDPVRQATHRHALDLERMGFYDRLKGRPRA